MFAVKIRIPKRLKGKWHFEGKKEFIFSCKKAFIQYLESVPIQSTRIKSYTRTTAEFA